jgi:hypothetical protein
LAWEAKKGNSARHGAHQDAHLFTTTGVPLSSRSSRSNAGLPPSRNCTEEAGACAWLSPESPPQPASAAAQARTAITRTTPGRVTDPESGSWVL